MAAEDWRLRVRFRDDGPAHLITDRLRAFRVEHDLGSRFEDRVIVSRDGAEVFCYAADFSQLDRVAEAIRATAEQAGWRLDFEPARWHPAAAEWQPPEVPLPQSEEELAHEHALLVARERRESDAQGYPAYEVRVQCRSRADADLLADRFGSGGRPVVRRARFLLLGATDEDSAAALADQVRREAPEGTEVTVEPTPHAELPPNPFAVFGGVGG